MLCKLYPYFTPYATKNKTILRIFQQEPDMARLDRLFTPIRKSSKYMHVTLVQTSISLSGNFILLTNRSSGFGSYPCD